MTDTKTDGVRYVQASFPANVVPTEYLLEHESDIAFGINDFGELQTFFFAVFGRIPNHTIEL